ncbi:adapter protein MecA 1/2 [Halolactibacillus halophilus]|uniref:Adapter protein MecA n=1 Tax=Halolactibacillus halophilus TaxID=306540 RepID=A0A1I5PPE0_9BACI|nr:adaptor protein MecA [Halolactibacillus halophilus]GEM01571.1 adapter protein MecA 1 [Halolactibacillus halophilus]SFP36002.1 adapter protein MecA 1/2 [Halolactibacillus halophilus]
MKIERINDNTIKFYISYMDIEDRGFNREEIWYNRERSEQLFWQVMEEADHAEEDFEIEGPLWIQVQALEKGLEITVTKAQMSKDGQNLEVPVDQMVSQDQIQDKIESLLEQDHKGDHSNQEDYDDEAYKILPNLVSFKDFEDVIRLSHAIDAEFIDHAIYHYIDNYFMIYTFDDVHLDDIAQDGLKSKIEEYSTKSKQSIAMILEYGKPIFEEDGLTAMKHLFDL